MNRLNDINGKQSAKRMMGFRLFNIAIAMALVDFVVGLIMAILEKTHGFNFPLEIWWTFMGSGASLLGFTLFEKTNIQGTVNPDPGTPPPPPKK